MLKNGPIPFNISVLHRCDTPQCVNPDHLFLGTQKDNLDDMRSKGRGAGPNGTKNTRAKLTDKTAMEVFLAPGLFKDIAVEYDIPATQVGQIKLKRAWKHIHRQKN